VFVSDEALFASFDYVPASRINLSQGSKSKGLVEIHVLIRVRYRLAVTARCGTKTIAVGYARAGPRFTIALIGHLKFLLASGNTTALSHTWLAAREV